QHRQQRNKERPGQHVEQFEQGNRVIILHVRDQRVQTFIHDQVQGGVAKYREPQESEHRWHQHDTEHKLADGTAAADLGDKHAHKRRPGNGPAEDEQRPVTDPVTAAVGLQLEGTLDNTAQVAAGILQEGFQDVDGGPYHKHEQQQGHRQHHIQDRQAFYPFVHTRYHRHGRRRGNHRNGYNLHRGADRDTFPQVVDTRVNLGNRQAQGGG